MGKIKKIFFPIGLAQARHTYQNERRKADSHPLCAFWVRRARL